MKIDLPKFDGTDPHGWAFRAQEYFDYHETPDVQRVRIESFTMVGKTLDWYQYMKKNSLLGSWTELMDSVILRFGPSKYEDYQGALSKLTQKTIMAEYRSELYLKH